MSSIGKVYTPSSGPSSANIMIVGEAPGREEEGIGPFIGKSGQFLTRYLNRIGIDRDDVFLSNLCKYRPRKNYFPGIVESTELAAGLEELKQEIIEVDPMVIIACGNWPMYYLTGMTGKQNKPGSGINLWRGSTLPCILVEGKKVYCTYHPAYIIRPQGFKWNPVFLADLRRAKLESVYPELPYPKYEELIDPPENILNRLYQDMIETGWVSCDIESRKPGTPETYPDCIGFSSSERWGICITENHPSLWHFAKEVYEDPRVQLIFQFGNYDVNILHRCLGWEPGGYCQPDRPGWDTYIAAASLMPEFPRGLAFLASVYTRFPYFKGERGASGEARYKYNIKDCIATFQIAMRQMEEVEKKYE
jgi:uracil-DNA glycosylase